jgi:prepilin-type N-terminal cleavage/methylation domain-containing protein
MKLLRSSKGFTLIELVMVIAILGILAAVAMPKFYNFKGQAQNAAVAGVIGGVKSGIMSFAMQAQLSDSLPAGSAKTSMGYPIDLDGTAANVTPPLLLFQYVLAQPIEKDWLKTLKATTEGATDITVSATYTYLPLDSIINYYNKSGIFK